MRKYDEAIADLDKFITTASDNNSMTAANLTVAGIYLYQQKLDQAYERYKMVWSNPTAVEFARQYRKVSFNYLVANLYDVKETDKLSLKLNPKDQKLLFDYAATA